MPFSEPPRLPRTAVVIALLSAIGLSAPSRHVTSASFDAATTAQAVQLEITLHRGRVFGQAEPGTDVEIWRVDEMGREVGRWSATTTPRGTFVVELVVAGAGDRRTIDPLEPGQRLFVDLGAGGDPLVFTLPQLTLRSDPVDDRLSGEAPPGSRLALSIDERDDPIWQREEIVVGPDGRWSVSTAGEHDLVDGDHGHLVLLRDDGHRVVLDWAAPYVRIDLDSGHLSPIGPLHRRYEIRLLDPDGEERARLEGRSDPGGVGQFTSWEGGRLADLFGNPIRPRPGDRVAGFFGDDDIQLEIPHLEIALDSGSGEAHGFSNAPANSPLRLRMAGLERSSHSWPLAVDPDGRFRFDLAAAEPPWTLRPNDFATLELRPPGGWILAHAAVPGMFLHLAARRLELLLQPHEPATVRHLRRGGELRSIAVVADELGRADALLAQGEEPWDLAEGDVLRLEPERTPTEATSLTIPKLSLSLDLEANAMQGCLTLPEGADYRLTTDPFFRPWAELLRWQGGCFELRFDEHPAKNPLTGEEATFTLAPGYSATATVGLANGHVVDIRRRLARFHLQPESAEVCVTGDPYTEIALEREAAAGPPASGRARSDAHGRARVVLRDAGGAPRPIGRGQALRGTMDTTPYDMRVPDFHVEPDWPFFDLLLRGVAGTDVAAHFPGRYTDCWGGQEIPESQGHNFFWSSRATLDEAGSYPLNLLRLAERHGPDFRRGLVVEHPTTTGHRTYLRVYPLQLEALLGTNRLTGWGSQGETVDARLYDEDGRELGAASAVVDPGGRFEARLQESGSEDGAAVLLRPGRQLVGGTPSEEHTLVLAPLDFDWSVTSGLDGTTVPRANVALTFELVDGRTRTMIRTSDDDGVFTFRPAEIPNAEPWTTAQVAGLRAAIEVDDWHRVVRAWPRDPDAPRPTAAPATPTGAATARATPTDRAPSTPTAMPDGTPTPATTVPRTPTASRTPPPRPPVILRREIFVPWVGR